MTPLISAKSFVDTNLHNWHVFCKVVDNFGDIGVCWRLACGLAGRGIHVRLWVDDVSALTWMAPAGCVGVEVIDCKDGFPKDLTLEIGDVLLDTFGCDYAIEFIANYLPNTPVMAEIGIKNTLKRPVWLNLEYLTAESFAERNHTLPYVHHNGAAAGWEQRYFYPGFTKQTGGLLREADLFERQSTFDRAAWLRSILALKQLSYCEKTTYVSLFCYEPAALEALINQLAASEKRVCLLVTAGRASHAVKAVFDHINRTLPAYLLDSLLSILYLPKLSQCDYDHLLWSCDLNFVRGEDSLVRAIWAGKAFVWQIYQQDDGVHHTKLDAFLRMMNAPESLRTMHRAWNASERDNDAPPLPELDVTLWHQSALALRQKLLAQSDLCTQLIHYAHAVQKTAKIVG